MEVFLRLTTMRLLVPMSVLVDLKSGVVDKSSYLTTLSLDSLELATTGPRVTTLRELNWSTLSWMSSGKSPRDVIVSKYSSWPVP